MHSIGELARITGLSVRTIRFYSGGGAVPPPERSEAGYRLYDDEALARLELVKTCEGHQQEEGREAGERQLRGCGHLAPTIGVT